MGRVVSGGLDCRHDLLPTAASIMRQDIEFESSSIRLHFATSLPLPVSSARLSAPARLPRSFPLVLVQKLTAAS